MNRDDRDILEFKGKLKYQLLRMNVGLQEVMHQKKTQKIIITYLLTTVLLWGLFNIFVIPDTYPPAKIIFQFVIGVVYSTVVILGLLTALVLIGTPKGAYQINEELWRIGLTNHAGESPLLLRRYTIPGEVDTTVLEFDTNGIPFSKWHDEQERIETALDVYVTKMKLGENRRKILLYTVAGDAGLADVIHWKDEYLSKSDFELVLGQSFGEKVKVDLTKVPHILLGGSTGSGKSVLLKLLLMQCVKKGAQVFIADFKGGVDFSPLWHENCIMITKELLLSDALSRLGGELEYRKTILRKSGCANISEYNKTQEKKLQRIVLACDEVAEVLDKTGLPKEKKELISNIEQYLSTIARQGRAFGIHLILATQRPDANILAGQIRNNIDYRVCGRADNVLSQIILDNTDASERVPKDSQGLFLNHEGILFRGYLFDEKNAFAEGKKG